LHALELRLVALLSTTLGSGLALHAIILRCAFDTKLVIIFTMPSFAFFAIQLITMTTLLRAFTAILFAFAASLADALLA
jgi:hypothetical protein